MGFSSGTKCEKCGLDFSQVEKWYCRLPTYQVTLDITLNDAVPHKDNQRPNGNNIVVNLKMKYETLIIEVTIRMNKIMTINVNVIVVKFLIRIEV